MHAFVSAIDGTSVSIESIDLDAAPTCMLSALRSRQQLAGGGARVHVSGGALKAAKELLAYGKISRFPYGVGDELDYLCLGSSLPSARGVGVRSGDLILATDEAFDGSVSEAIGAAHAALCCRCSLGRNLECDVSVRPQMVRGTFVASAVPSTLCSSEFEPSEPSTHVADTIAMVSGEARFRGVRFLPRDQCFEAFLPVHVSCAGVKGTLGSQGAFSANSRGAGTRSVRGLRVYISETAAKPNEAHLGVFPTAEAAARAHDHAVLDSVDDSPFASGGGDGSCGGRLSIAHVLNFPLEHFAPAEIDARATAADAVDARMPRVPEKDDNGPLLAAQDSSSHTSDAPLLGRDGGDPGRSSDATPIVSCGGPELVARMCVSAMGLRACLQRPEDLSGCKAPPQLHCCGEVPHPRWARDRLPYAPGLASDSATGSGAAAAIPIVHPPHTRFPTHVTSPPSISTLPLTSLLADALRYTPLRGLRSLSVAGPHKLSVSRLALAASEGGQLTAPCLPRYGEPSAVAFIVCVDSTDAVLLRRRAGSRHHVDEGAGAVSAGEGGEQTLVVGPSVRITVQSNYGVASAARPSQTETPIYIPEGGADPRIVGRACAIIPAVGCEFSVAITGADAWHGPPSGFASRLPPSPDAPRRPRVSVLCVFPEGGASGGGGGAAGPLNLADVLATHASLTEVAALC